MTNSAQAIRNLRSTALNLRAAADREREQRPEVAAGYEAEAEAAEKEIALLSQPAAPQ